MIFLIPFCAPEQNGIKKISKKKPRPTKKSPPPLRVGGGLGDIGMSSPLYILEWEKSEGPELLQGTPDLLSVFRCCTAILERKNMATNKDIFAK